MDGLPVAALTVNLTYEMMLMRFRRHSGSLTTAAFLYTLANIAIIAAGLLTTDALSAGPDLIVGLALPP